MIKICIGIVDDDKQHVMDIKRVFARYSKLEDTALDITFESFYKDENSDYGTLLSSIIDAIKAQSIDCMIIDYKLVFVHETNKGIAITGTAGTSAVCDRRAVADHGLRERVFRGGL